MKKLIVLALIFQFSISVFAQVESRDSILNWQHHEFELNEDYSMGSYSSNDNDIQQVQFEAKVIENELIRLVIVPEYGARVISFVYKPTGYEYLYQSECGSPYGIYEGNFYYNWLMVYGGIFPTFPEPEHGKTWFLPWYYSVIKNTSDTVIIRMEYTDNTSFNGAPGGFNNGITNITCQIDIGVYSNSSVWDFDVKLINNNNSTVNYEYWTCTTLTPGSELGETGSPLNSEMIVPIDQYKAAWSPGSWIGNWGGLYNYDLINYLDEWEDMGIGYAHNLTANYWGVINHDNEEGIFRLSENVETPGMKFWTWGRDNVDNDLYDFSNGGADNYIELWAGNSLAFFEDANMTANQERYWKESYVATSKMTGIAAINNRAALNHSFDSNTGELTIEINKFQIDENYSMAVSLAGVSEDLLTENYLAEQLQALEVINLKNIGLHDGEYELHITVNDPSNQSIIGLIEMVNLIGVDFIETVDKDIVIQNIRNHELLVQLPGQNYSDAQLVDISGRVISNLKITQDEFQIKAPKSGLYILQLLTDNKPFTKKLWID